MPAPRPPRYFLPLLVLLLLLALACGLLPGAATPVPIRTLDPAKQYLGPTLSATGANRPSPGGWIAFLKGGDLWMIHPDSSGLKQITQNLGATDLRLGWSSDGQYLAYANGGNLTVLHMAGLGSYIIATDAAGSFDWSATAPQLVYDTSLSDPAAAQPANDGLRFIAADGSGIRPVRAAGYPVMLHPLWSFDSRRVIFTTPDATSPHLFDAATGLVSDLLPGASAEASCNWSPVELIIACLDGSPPAPATPTVILFDPEGKEQRRFALTPDQQHARLGPWSPDGGSLIVTYSSGSVETTGILNIDSGELKQLAPGHAASWSPDSRWVVMDGSPSAPQSLTVVNTSDGTVSPLVDGSSPVWQPAAPDDASALTGGTAVPGSADYCLDTSAGFVHKKPKGYYLQFCIGAQKYNYGGLAGGVYVVGPQARYFIYASNSGFAFAARMGDPTLTRIGNFRWFRIFHVFGEPDPRLELRFITGYPNLIQVYESTFKQKDTYTLPARMIAP